MEYLAKAIKNLKPESEFSYSADDYSTINWIILEGDAPTQKEIDAEIKRIKASEISEAKAKAEQRQAIAEKLGLTADELQVLLG